MVVEQTTERRQAPHAQRGQYEKVAMVAVALAVVVVLAARAPFALERFWAEDGRVFYADAIELGPLRPFTESAAGYYLFVPRIAGAISSLVPVRQAPLAVWCSVAAVNAWLAATVMVSGRTWIRAIPGRAILALGLVLLPILGMGSIANIASVQFVMLFVSLVVLLSTPATTAERVNGTILLVATGFTTPLSAVLAPCAVWRLVRERRWRDAYLIGWAAGLAVQLAMLGFLRPDGRDRSGEPIADTIERFGDLALRGNFMPLPIIRFVGPTLAVLITAGLALAAWTAWRRDERPRAVLTLGVPLLGLAVLVASGLYATAPSRYMIFPSLCLVWGMVVGAESLAGLAPPSWHATPTKASTVLAVLLLAVWLPGWFPNDSRSSGRDWGDALDAAAAECESMPDDKVVLVDSAPVDPDRPRQWSVPVPCSKLR